MSSQIIVANWNDLQWSWDDFKRFGNNWQRFWLGLETYRLFSTIEEQIIKQICHYDFKIIWNEYIQWETICTELKRMSNDMKIFATI